MPTLSELTLQHSRDLSALEAECRARQDEIERDRQAALHGLATARPALQQFEKARADAAALRDNAVAHAATAFATAQIQARDKRVDALNKVQSDYLSADRAADAARLAARNQEDADYRARLIDIEHTVSLDKQFAAREAATAKHEAALAAIDARWRSTYDADRDRQQADLEGALDRERLDVDAADRAREAAVAAARVTFDAAVNLAVARLNAAIAALPETASLSAEFDARRNAAQQDCHAREEELFARFREALKTATP
jgi:hypothetical protein